LDLYPNASSGYSLRLLRTAYTGNAIRVRRSSDNAEQDIGFVSGNLDITSLTTFCLATNGFVTTWYDQSVNGRNATQTTASNQPVIVTAGVVNLVNLKPAIYFNNGNTTQLNCSLLNLNNFTILWVSKKTILSNNQSIILGGGSSDYAGDDVDVRGNPTLYASGPLVIGVTLSNTSPTGAIKLTQHLAYLNRRNSNEAVGQFNNSSNSYNNSVPSSVFKNTGIANYGSAYNYVGDLQEIIIYATDESANRTGISSNINTYYAIY
jgi:hypothetical protein